MDGLARVIIPCCCSGMKWCLTLCMDRSTPAHPVLHQPPEFAQTHVHWVGDSIQPSHPLSSPFPPSFNLSQHQGPFQWIRPSNQVAKVLELQQRSFQWLFRLDFLRNGLVGSPCSPRDSQESSPTPQLESISSSALGLLYGPTLTSVEDSCKNPSLDLDGFSVFILKCVIGMACNARAMLSSCQMLLSSFSLPVTHLWTRFNERWNEHFTLLPLRNERQVSTLCGLIFIAIWLVISAFSRR